MLIVNDRTRIDGIDTVVMESNTLRLELVPEIGGRIISIIDKSTGNEFLWRNNRIKLTKSEPGSIYDPNFYGGIDELIPNDVPENFDGIYLPDHGEIWTTPLKAEYFGKSFALHGYLPITGLDYNKSIFVNEKINEIQIFYRLDNKSNKTCRFMWKHHAALNIIPGDILEFSARKAQVIDPQWSRWKNMEPFNWPYIEGSRADLIPPSDKSLDFLYLYDLERGYMALKSTGRDMEFSYNFDTGIFTYGQYFASYGGLDGHYTAVLEPCSSMPLMLSEAALKNQCTVIPPGKSIETSIKIYAGTIRNK